MVRALRAVLTVLLAIAWWPLTAHCQLEGLPGLELLRCVSGDAGEPADGSHCDDGCCAWESSQYHLPLRQAPRGADLCVFVPWAPARVESVPPAELTASFPTSPPPEPSRPWQFRLRAALPVRAPSIAA